MRPLRVPVRRGLIGSALLVLLAMTDPVRAQPAGAVGGVAGLTGRVDVTHHDETEPRPLVEGAAILEGDRVRTHPGARVRLVLADGAVLQLGESTSLDIDWVLHAPALGMADVLLEVAGGIVRAIVDNLVPTARYEVVTLTAVTSVRGTDWIIEATPGMTAVVALDGAVAVRNRAEAVPGEVMLGPGEGTTVMAGAPPDAPSVWGDARRQSFVERTSVP